MVSHEVLLSKLEDYGVMGIVLNCFRSYINDKRQRVSLECTATHSFQSDWESMKYRYQRFHLGPNAVKYMYINNLYKIMDKLSHTLLYADVINIIVTATTYNDLQKCNSSTHF